MFKKGDSYDLSIPINETDQGRHSPDKEHSPVNIGSLDDLLDDKPFTNVNKRLSEMEIRSQNSNIGLTRGSNLNQKRVMPDTVNRSDKRPSLMNDDGYVPLSCLNTFSQDWTIKVKIYKKG